MIPELVETHRQRQQLLRAQTRLTLQIGAMARRVRKAKKAKIPEEVRLAKSIAEFATLPLETAKASIHAELLKPERRLKKLGRDLPHWEQVKGIVGLSELGYAQIIAEAGDLTGYANPAKLWKRFGLAVMPDGRRQRRVTGAAAIEHGYSPRRRAVMAVVGDNLIRRGKAVPTVYYELYAEQKERYREKWPEASDMQVHRAAKRYIEKRLLRDLWRLWRADAPTA